MAVSGIRRHTGRHQSCRKKIDVSVTAVTKKPVIHIRRYTVIQRSGYFWFKSSFQHKLSTLEVPAFRYLPRKQRAAVACGSGWPERGGQANHHYSDGTYSRICPEHPARQTTMVVLYGLTADWISFPYHRLSTAGWKCCIRLSSGSVSNDNGIMLKLPSESRFRLPAQSITSPFICPPV